MNLPQSMLPLALLLATPLLHAQAPDTSPWIRPIGPALQQLETYAEQGTLSAYVGTYCNDYYGEIEVTAAGNALWLRLPARGSLYRLSRWDGDTFTYRFEEEQSIGTRSVVFSFSGTPQVTIDNLRLKGNGVFKRIEGGQF